MLFLRLNPNQSLKMKSYPVLLKLLLLLLPLLSVAQDEKNEVDIIPHWEKGEQHKVLIKNTTTDIAHQKTNQYISTFNANFTVVEKNDDDYIIEWVVTSAKLAPADKILENVVFASLVNQKIVIQFSDYGKFIKLLNEDELRKEANKTLDKIIATTPDQNYKLLLNGAKKVIMTKQGLESIMLKPIKFYHYCYGHHFKLNEEMAGNVLIPNALGGTPFDAVEKVKLTAIDQQKSICRIESSKIADGATITKIVKDFFIKNNKGEAKEIEKQFGNNDLESSEAVIHEINFNTGTVQKASFKRKVNLGVYNRTALSEIQSID